MRFLLWLFLFFLFIAGIVLPAAYFYIAQTLPPLESEFDIDRAVRGRIESERVAYQSGLAGSNGLSGVRPWKPARSLFPPELTAFYFAWLNCPEFDVSNKEESIVFAARLVRWALNFGERANSGACERVFSERIVDAAGIDGRARSLIATLRVHRALSKDLLVAYALSVPHLEYGVMGLEDASVRLFKDPPSKLTVSQLAELTLADPLFGEYPALKLCQNPSRLRADRDVLLKAAGKKQLLNSKVVAEALSQPLSCAR